MTIMLQYGSLNNGLQRAIFKLISTGFLSCFAYIYLVMQGNVIGMFVIVTLCFIIFGPLFIYLLASSSHSRNVVDENHQNKNSENSNSYEEDKGCDDEVDFQISSSDSSLSDASHDDFIEDNSDIDDDITTDT